MFPLAVPGGLEIGIVILIFLLPLLFVIGVVLLVRDLFGTNGADPDRIDELETRVHELEQQVKSTDDGSDDP